MEKADTSGLFRPKRRLIAVCRYLGGLILLGTLVCMLWPFLQYYIDPDALSYLNLSRDYLAGHYQEAINAYWSPMGIWLTVLWERLSGIPYLLLQLLSMQLVLPAHGQPGRFYLISLGKILLKDGSLE